MDITGIILISIGLAMDAFSVSVCKGLTMKRINVRGAVITALFFGVFQGVMPLIGYFLGSRFADYITSVSHWVSFGLLAVIGGKMALEAVFEKDEDEGGKEYKLVISELFVLAIATSIDALAVGIVFVAEEVNLLLAVGEKRPDGYHDLVSVMQTVGVWDELTIRTHTDGGIALTCDNADLPADETNLCYKAAVKFFSYTGVTNDGVSIDLKKVLPMQAGLGGGSADAAAVLRGLRRLYAPELPDAELEAMAADLGSDVPFCVRGGTVSVRGRGERLETLPCLPESWFVLVKPPLACSTGRMYGLIDEGRFYDSGAEQAEAMAAALDRGDLPGVCGAMLNTFERVLPPDSEIFTIRQRLLDLGALGAMLSGSGSAVFAVFDREDTARMAVGALRGTYPETFCGKSE